MSVCSALSNAASVSHFTAVNTSSSSSFLLPVEEYDIITKPLFLDNNYFFEVTEPEEISYTYKMRPAKDFGAHLVSCMVHSVMYGFLESMTSPHNTHTQRRDSLH